MPTLLSPISAGTRFGNDETQFELQDKIGEGGQGQVFVCVRVDQDGGKQVRYAAKVIPTVTIGRQRNKLEQLRQEIAIMERLHHPRVVNMHMYFFEEESERVIIVMDLAPDGDLFGKIEQELTACQKTKTDFPGIGGSERGPKYATRQFLDAIGYMHHRKVTHRDLKAENILVHRTHPIEGSNCKVFDIKIADFGLSKWHDDKGYSTPGGGGGTKRYAAPERFKNLIDPNFHELDEMTAEFWSLGVIIYLTLCARFPYTVHKDTKKNLEDMENLSLECNSWSLVSHEGQQFVKGLLTVDPGKRLCLDGEHNCLVHPWLEGESTMSREASRSPTKHQGVIRQVRGWTGDAVDCIEFCMRDGHADFEVGVKGGQPLNWVQLNPDEVIVAAMQESRDSYLGNAVVLYTSQCRIIAIEGKSSKERARFIAPRDSQIVGLQFDGNRLIGIHLESFTGKGAVEEISGRSATCVDNVRIKLRNGAVRTYGSPGGGQPVLPFHMYMEERIMVVEQLRRDWFLGSALIFYTSAGRVFKVQGVGSQSRHFAAGAGEQIRALRFEGSNLREIVCCAASGDSNSPGKSFEPPRRLEGANAPGHCEKRSVTEMIIK
mmetsp:Transcript_9254/g.20687  ORF Transcript_9254/g.20687 Transcript_9254/m.20687 type:complete len:603 (+) Transcript_9254:104-1912(+)|eukprot:CAMPEP_0178395698 /NCGR_PEP_ID=MMETSP0689_2-20121128/13352_1 /TAXON_ID=160604 /ORGANISM="Amphidinium massartii, Strain CS-259" /LENGTH=602 /DNA_ID=CAMNT_0020016359 /DNA_START=32 /DNA_END=1840 /DNA_ORIENTATION=-